MDIIHINLLYKLGLKRLKMKKRQCKTWQIIIKNIFGWPKTSYYNLNMGGLGQISSPLVVQWKSLVAVIKNVKVLIFSRLFAIYKAKASTYTTYYIFWIRLSKYWSRIKILFDCFGASFRSSPGKSFCTIMATNGTYKYAEIDWICEDNCPNSSSVQLKIIWLTC